MKQAHVIGASLAAVAALSTAVLVPMWQQQKPVDANPGVSIAVIGVDIPDPAKTPGVVLNVTAKDVCVRGYAGKVRNVPESEKNAVYKEYGIKSHKPGEYEIDHDVSLELGGSNDIRNLWPQSYVAHPWNAHLKDSVENALHVDVCSGKITLLQAQSAIRGDWTVEYRNRFGNPK